MKAPLPAPAQPPRCLMIFVDGLGLAASCDPKTNPVYAGRSPFLAELLEREARPIDACLGVAGLPQSATGQTALLCGVNAPREVGAHAPGFPGPTLRAIVREHNIFSRLEARGYRSTFANGYYLEGIDPQHFRRRRSVTTVATLKAFNALREHDRILANRAVCQDLTRQLIRDRGFDGPATRAEEAAEHLVDIAGDYHFTLFEFFQTDLKAHKGTWEENLDVLALLDRFLQAVFAQPGFGQLDFILTSDHGNVEDFTTRSHTRNPVPLITHGSVAPTLHDQVKDLADIVPALLSHFPDGNGGRSAGDDGPRHPW